MVLLRWLLCLFIFSPYKVCCVGELHAVILAICSNSRLRKCVLGVCMRPCACVCLATYFFVLGFSPWIWYVLAAYGHTLDWKWFLFCCLLISLACRTVHHRSYIALSLSTCFAPALKCGTCFMCPSLSRAWSGVWYLVEAQQMFLEWVNRREPGTFLPNSSGKRRSQKGITEEFENGAFLGANWLFCLISFVLVSIFIE